MVCGAGSGVPVMEFKEDRTSYSDWVRIRVRVGVRCLGLAMGLWVRTTGGWGSVGRAGNGAVRARPYDSGVGANLQLRNSVGRLTLA